MKATWTRINGQGSDLPRSSQVLAVTDGAAYVFSGELKPREPVSNEVIELKLDGNGNNKYKTLDAASSGDKPIPRVGSASTTLGDTLYLFSGRGGLAMAPLEEDGLVWSYSLSNHTWTQLKPSSADARYPPGRSYHCMTNDGNTKLYMHAGCPENGRLSDLWLFNISAKSWTELASAPDPPRGGTSITFANGKLYRMNGFDGKTEQGGQLDIYDIGSNAWSSHSFAPDGKSGPTPRSVTALLAVTVNGRRSLVTVFGEQDPSALGHAGAGKMLSDVWVYDIDGKAWTKAECQGNDLPAARGWFAAEILKADESKIVVHGGLGENNERLGDCWVLSLEN